jgi:cell division septation protein DedD
MVKKSSVNGYGTVRVKSSLPSIRHVSLVGLLILVGTLAWLVWNKYEQPVQVKSAEITRSRAISPIPPSPVKENMRLSFHIVERDGLQKTAVASVQEPVDSFARDDHLKQKNTSEGNYELEDSSLSSDNRGFVIQVGAFRKKARAESLQKALMDKGYDAYLEGRNLPEFGLFHRVRIRGYTSLAAAKEELERLQQEEGLDAIIIKSDVAGSDRK